MIENYLEHANQSQNQSNKAFRTDRRYFDRQVDAPKIQKHDLGFGPEWVMSFTERGKTA